MKNLLKLFVLFTLTGSLSAQDIKIPGGNVWTTKTQTLTNKTLTAPVISAGTSSAGTWPKITAGTLLTTPEAGALEYDGSGKYITIDTTAGRTQIGNTSFFMLTANGSAIGATIADYFGTNSAYPTVTNGIYEFWFYCNFLKTTSGSVTWTITNTQAYTNINAYYTANNAAGISTNASVNGSGITGVTTAAAALAASGNLTDATNQRHVIHAIVEVGTAGNIRLRATESSGTITPQRGSYYTVRRLGSASVGTFVP